MVSRLKDWDWKKKNKKKDWDWDHPESLMRRNGTQIIKAEKSLIPF